jgi:hypothetical protein
VEKFPSIMVLSDPDGYKGAVYDGPLNRDKLEKWLNQYAYQTIKVEKTASVRELSSDVYIKQKICNESDNKNICVIYMTKNDILNGDENQMLEDLAKKYVNDPIKVFYLNPGKYKYFWVSFDNEDSDSNFIILRGKRKRYCPIKKNTLADVSTTIDNILSGGGSFKKLIKKLNVNIIADNKEEL